MHTLVKETIINKPLEEVFSFFSKAENLNLITPPELDFKILSPQPINIKQGAIIDYSIKLNGISFKWKTEITVFEKNKRFIDTQLKGPYKIWIHEHIFEHRGNATYMKDIVQFKSPGWIFEPIINSLFVEKKVKSIFEYREKILNKIFSE